MNKEKILKTSSGKNNAICQDMHTLVMFACKYATFFYKG